MASRILTFKTMKDGEYKLKDTTGSHYIVSPRTQSLSHISFVTIVLILTFEALDNDQGACQTLSISLLTNEPIYSTQFPLFGR
jgi:malate synthase